MKTTRLFILLFLFFSTVSAQEKGKIRGGVDLSIDNTLIQALSNNATIIDCIGRSYTFSLNYNLTDNMNIGLKYLNQTLLMYDNLNFNNSYIGKDGNILLVDYNYYLHKKKWSVSPFVEFGIGVLYFKSQNVCKETYASSSGNNGIKYVYPKYTLSQSIATGIEFNHIRLSIEYLFTLPKPTINIYDWHQTYDGHTIETWSKNNNVSLNRMTLKLGFYIGGGRWKK